MMLVFGWPNSDTLRAWAKSLPNQDINEIKGCYHHWFNEDELINADLTDYSFFIVIAKDLGISDDSIFLTFSLAHELEHVVQYSEERVLSLQAGLIESYLSLSNQWNNSTYQDFPPEMDAFRTAKQINFILHSEDKTQAFIDRRISESSDPDDSAYWQHINTLELEDDYNWKSLIRLRWKEYEDAIFRMKCSSRAFLKEYEYYETIINKLTSAPPPSHS